MRFPLGRLNGGGQEARPTWNKGPSQACGASMFAQRTREEIAERSPGFQPAVVPVALRQNEDKRPDLHKGTTTAQVGAGADLSIKALLHGQPTLRADRLKLRNPLR